MENREKKDLYVIKTGRSMKSVAVYIPCHYCNELIYRQRGRYIMVCTPCEIKNLKKGK